MPGHPGPGAAGPREGDEPVSRTAEEWDDAYAERAASGATLWTAGPNRTVAEVLTDVAPGTAVDVAAGEGRHAVWLADRGWQVSAVDFSAIGLARAERAAAEAGTSLTTVCADVARWEPDQQVDLVLCAFLHLPSTVGHPMLRRFTRWIAPGGLLVLLGHDRDNLSDGTGGPQDDDVLWDRELLRTVAEEGGLEVVRSEQVRRPVDGAPRPAIDVLLVARRGR